MRSGIVYLGNSLSRGERFDPERRKERLKEGEAALLGIDGLDLGQRLENACAIVVTIREDVIEAVREVLAKIGGSLKVEDPAKPTFRRASVGA